MEEAKLYLEKSRKAMDGHLGSDSMEMKLVDIYISKLNVGLKSAIVLLL